MLAVADCVVASMAIEAMVGEAKDGVFVRLTGARLASMHVYVKLALVPQPVRISLADGMLYETTEKPDSAAPGGQATDAPNMSAGRRSPRMHVPIRVATPVVSELRARQTKLIMYMLLAPEGLVRGEASPAAEQRSSCHERRPCPVGQATRMS